MLHVAPDGRVRSANAAARRVLGVDELVGVSIASALSLLRDADGHHLSDAMVPGVTALTSGLPEPWRLVRALSTAWSEWDEATGESAIRWLLVGAVPVDHAPSLAPAGELLAEGGGRLTAGSALGGDGVTISLIDVTGTGMDVLFSPLTTVASKTGTVEIVLTSDAAGRFTDVSPAASALLGHSRHDLVRRSWRDQVHPADRDLLFADQEAAVDDAHLPDPDGPRSYGVRIRFRHAEGHYLWLECVTCALVARTGPGDSDEPLVLGHRTTIRDVTVEVEMEIRQGEAERQLSLTLDNAPIGMALVALDGSFLRVNQALCSIVGYPAHELMALSFQEITHPDDLDADLSLLAQLVSGEIAEYALDKRYVHRDGRTVWVRLSMTLLCDDDDEPLHYISQVEDITERRVVQQRIADSERRYRLLAENASDIISRLDVHGTLLWLSPACERILGRSAESLIGTSLADLVHQRDRAGLAAALCEVRNGRSGSVTSRVRHVDGRWIWLESRLHAVLDAEGTVTEVQSVCRDVTERQQARAELERLALTDPLTGLANRALLFNHLQSALARMRRTGGALALMLIDLDRFKEINDTLGHPVGDELIRQAATRLRAVARPSDTVARLGGDELVVLVDGLPDAGAAQVVADRILGNLREPYRLTHVAQPLSVTASMGISMTTDPEQPLEDLYRQADLALYRAKDGGRDRWAFFETSLEREVRHRLEIHRALRQAIDGGRLEVHYQPVVDLGRGTVTGAEALVRVQDGEGALLAPDTWLSVAEETGLLSQIDSWVMRAAAAQAASWSSRPGSDVGPQHIAINVSAGAFADPRYCDALVASIRANGLAPESLRVELTEHSLLGDTVGARRALYRLASLGVGLGIDDFGTGYSSLSGLHQLPISFVKIDRSFISSMTTDNRRHEVVRAVIDLVHGLGHSVVAEGVETEDQLTALQALGCDAAQGYLFGRPVPASEFASTAPVLPRTG